MFEVCGFVSVFARAYVRHVEPPYIAACRTDLMMYLVVSTSREFVSLGSP